MDKSEIPKETLLAVAVTFMATAMVVGAGVFLYFNQPKTSPVQEAVSTSPESVINEKK